MPDNHIGISTSADLSGVNALKQGLLEIRKLSQEISKSGIHMGAPSSGEMPQVFTQTAIDRINSIQQQAAGSTIGAQALNQNPGAQMNAQPSGVQVGLWAERNWPVISEMMGNVGTSQSRVPRPQKYVAKQGTFNLPNSAMRKYTTRVGDAERPQQWTGEAWNLMNAGKLVPTDEQAEELIRAMGAGAPAQVAFYNKRAAEANMMPVPQLQSPGNSGRSGGLGIAGTVLRAALPARGIGGAIGTAIGGVGLGGLALGGAAAAVTALGVSSFNQYMQSGNDLSGLTKQILSTKDSLETLQNTVNDTGRAMGYLPDQVARIANTLGTAYGSMSLSQMNRGIAQVTGMGRAYGVSADVLAQGFAGAAQLGLTTGPGSMMNQGQFAMGLANSAAQSGMSGRMAELMQEVLAATQSIESTSVTTNPNTLLGIITAMNANLPRAMQGVGGAQVIGQMSSAMANPNGLQQLINYQALSKAGVNGYFNIMKAQQMGPGYVLPNGQTNAQAVFGQYNSMFGGNAPQEEWYIQQGLGVSMPQADQLLKIFGPGGTGVSGLKNNLGVTSKQLQGADWGKLALLGQLGAAKSESDLQAIEKDYAAGGGILSDAQKKALASGTTSQKQKILAQDILSGTYNPKTGSENIGTMYATVKSLSISIGGDIANGINSIVGGSNALAGGKGTNKNQNDNSFWGSIQKFFSGLAQGVFAGSPMSYAPSTQSTTPGGYIQTASMLTAYAGMSGMNNAFPWMRIAGSSGGIAQTSTGKRGNGINNGVFYPNGSTGSAGTTSVPSSILGGIMSVESGGNPYSLMDDTTGKSYSLSNKADYLRIGQQLLNAGDSVDMGLMQINSKAHPNVSLSQADDPDFAINWASNYLSSAYKRTGSWDKAIQSYNPGDPSYLGKVQNAENKFEIGDPTIAKLAQAIASALKSSGGGNGNGRYLVQS